MSRSGSPYSTPRDANRVPLLAAASTADGITPVVLEADPVTHLLQVSSSGGGGGGTSSTFSAAFPTTGTAVGASDGTNMKPLLVDGSGYLEVNVKAGSGSGLSVTDEASWTAGTSAFVPSGGVFNDSAIALTSGQQGTVRLTANRSMHTTTDNGALESGGNLATIATNTGNSATSANQTNGAQLAKIYDNVSTSTANVVAGDTGFNGVATASATKTYTFTTSASGAQTILANTPCEGYSWIEIVYTSVGSGLALTGQYSTTSGGTYVNSASFGSGASSASTAALGVTNNAIFAGPIRGNFFQIAVSALTSGTFAGTVTLRAMAPPLATMSSAQAGTWTMGSNSATGSAVPANAFYMGGNNSSSGSLTGATMLNSPTDGISTYGSLLASNYNYLLNGTGTFDRVRSASAAANTGGTGLLGAGVLGYDGADWQYTGIDSSHNLKTHDAATSGTTSAAPSSAIFMGVQSSGSILQGASAPNNLGDAGSGNSALATGQIIYNGTSYDRTRSASAAAGTTGTGLLGAAALGFDGTNYQRMSTNSSGVQNINLNPSAVGGWTPYFANAITTTVTVSSAAGKFGGYQLINLNSTPAYLQCFDTTGAVTLGTTAPTFVITLPANATASNGIAATDEYTNGIALANGLKVAATTTANGATTVSTGLSGSILYH